MLEIDVDIGRLVVGEHGSGLCAVKGTAQQLHPDLKPSFTGPAPQPIERILEIPHTCHDLIKLGAETGEIRQWCKKALREDEIEERGVLRQVLGQPRSPRHDLGDERQKAGIGVKQREQLHPGRKVREELVEPPQRRIGVRGRAEYPQQLRYEFGQNFARSLYPCRNADHGRPVDIVAQRFRGLNRNQRILGKPHGDGTLARAGARRSERNSARGKEASHHFPV